MKNKRPQTRGLERCPEERHLRRAAAALSKDIDREILKKILKNANRGLLDIEEKDGFWKMD